MTRDPEARKTQSGISTCSFTVAVQRRYKNAQGVYEADFIPVVCWRELSDVCVKYLQKGSKVAVQGSLQTRNYEAKDGSKRTAFEIIAGSVEFLSRNENKGEQEHEEEQAEEERPTNMTPADDEDSLPF